MRLDPRQVEILQRPLGATRVATRKGGGNKTLSYLEQWDVRAHLNRIFGFTNFDVLTRESTIEYAHHFPPTDSKAAYWLVGCRALVEVRIRNADGEELARYSDVAFAQAQNNDRGEATDQALKSAVSDALKRACTNLGDQFGLSLYNNGSITPVVRHLALHAPEPGNVSTVETTTAEEIAATLNLVDTPIEDDPTDDPRDDDPPPEPVEDGTAAPAEQVEEEAQGWR